MDKHENLELIYSEEEIQRKNEAGQNLVDEILTHPESIRVKCNRPRYGEDVFDIKIPNAGVRYTGEGEFIGLVHSCVLENAGLFEFAIVSAHDREKLTCEVCYKTEIIAEITQETDELRVEIYAPQAGWDMPLLAFQQALEDGKKYLLEY